MGSVAYVERDKKNLFSEVHHIARLGGQLVDSSESSVWVQNDSKSSLVIEVKEKQDRDPCLVKLKKAVKDLKVEVFSVGGDGVLYC